VAGQESQGCGDGELTPEDGGGPGHEPEPSAHYYQLTLNLTGTDELALRHPLLWLSAARLELERAERRAEHLRGVA
jgi:hypothetical protein